MIKFTKLSWSNCFSYGDNNTLDLASNTLTQLLGKNGNGKSSIALILEEVLFNTNSKKIKKADIINRYIKAKNYTITCEFEKDGHKYKIHTVRTATASSVQLTRDNNDISNHTATGTYKSIEHILGFDHKTFSQIVYQSNISSLEFLTATDSARKKFLIDLLDLGKYTKALDVFKTLASDTGKHVDALTTKINTINSWLSKYKGMDLTIMEIEEPIPYPTGMVELRQNLNVELANIDSTNKKILKNNTYKDILDGIDITDSVIQPSDDIVSLKMELASLEKELSDGAVLSKKPTTMVIKCPTCSQDMDNSIMFSRYTKFTERKPILLEAVEELKRKIAEHNKLTTAWTSHHKRVQEWEKYHILYDPKLPSVPIDEKKLIAEIASYSKSIEACIKAIDETTARNKRATDHNSKVSVIKEQMEEFKKELESLNEEYALKFSELNLLQILVKTFSTTGLVAYKIECLVKDLEELTNKYLAVMADGRFQLSFKIASADKLNVVITDNGRDIDIVALSSGERARVNISTLLAIRKLMQTLSNSRANLLILDETIESLDIEGKEKLVEVLLAEDSLNTILVSHSFSHPLIERINVIKEHNVSRIES